MYDERLEPIIEAIHWFLNSTGGGVAMINRLACSFGSSVPYQL